MATPAQIAANRRNAANSTGPRTPEGKRRVSRNAITHGLDCADVVLPGEDRAAFEHYRRAMLADNQPVGAQEQDCVEAMVAAQWRVRRLWRAEGEIHAQAARRLKFEPDVGTAILSDAQHEKGLVYLDRREASLLREYHRSSRRLQELQKQRCQGLRHVIDDETEAPAAHANAPVDSATEESAEQSQLTAVQGSEFEVPGEETGTGSGASGSPDGVFGKSAEQSQLAGEGREAA